jgi:hypothetical protein
MTGKTNHLSIAENRLPGGYGSPGQFVTVRDVLTSGELLQAIRQGSACGDDLPGDGHIISRIQEKSQIGEILRH